MLVPAFTRPHRGRMQVLCNYDLELAAAKYFHRVTDGEVPLAFHFNGSVYYRGEDGRLQIVQIPWDTSADFAMPIEVWKEMIDSYYPYRGWMPAAPRRRSSALRGCKAERGAADLRRGGDRAARERRTSR